MTEAAMAEHGLTGDVQTAEVVSTDGSLGPRAQRTVAELASAPGAVSPAGTPAPSSR